MSVIPEAKLEEGVPQTPGWFVVNARDARWLHNELGAYCGFEGEDARFAELGINLNVLPPGKPMAMYHEEEGEEAFRVLRGECLLIVEGQERGLKAWDSRNSDWSGHHVAFYVTDIGAAVEYMDSRGVTRMFGPFSLTAGPAAGQTINYFKTPWGSYIEFISYPNGMAYQVLSVKPLWSPKQNGLEAPVTKVPGLLGIDHVGITVPDIAVAAQWFERNLGFANPLTFGPFSDPVGNFMTALVDVHPRAVVEQIRVLRGGNGPGVELFKYTSPDQDMRFRRNSDWGGHHIALYVRHIGKGVEYLQTKAGSKLDGPLPVTAGPAAGQTINYFKTPFGTNVELISYPHGMAYEETAPIPLWDPRDNHP